jgi:hypothetical protein
MLSARSSSGLAAAHEISFLEIGIVVFSATHDKYCQALLR